MKTQFDHENEALEALNGERGKALGFCPLIKESCKTDCICYYEGDIHEPNAEFKWVVHYPCCTNVLISGEITADVRY